MLEKIILDTNFILIPIQFHVDIFSEFNRLLDNFKLYLLERSVDELYHLENGRYVSLCKKIIDLHNITILENEKNIPVDDLLLELGTVGYIIATNDKELRSHLYKKRVNHIFMRQKNKLQLEQFDRFK